MWMLPLYDYDDMITIAYQKPFVISVSVVLFLIIYPKIQFTTKKLV